MRKRLRHHNSTIHFQRKYESSSGDAWSRYIRLNHPALEEGLPSIRLDDLFDKQIDYVGPISHLNAGMLPNDLALLRGLASLYSECRYFEIGKRRSESLGNMAAVASECCALTRPAGDMRRKGIRHKYMFMMGSYSAAQNNVVILSGDSSTFDFSTLDRKFDIIFINNGKSYERILTVTRKAYEYLAHEKSTIVWHDYTYFPEQINFEVLSGILDGTDPADREQLFFISRTKCAILLKPEIYKIG